MYPFFVWYIAIMKLMAMYHSAYAIYIYIHAQSHVPMHMAAAPLRLQCVNSLVIIPLFLGLTIACALSLPLGYNVLEHLTDTLRI